MLVVVMDSVGVASAFGVGVSGGRALCMPVQLYPATGTGEFLKTGFPVILPSLLPCLRQDMSEESKFNFSACYAAMLECLGPVRKAVTGWLGELHTTACALSEPGVHHTHPRHVSNIVHRRCGLPGNPLDIDWPTRSPCLAAPFVLPLPVVLPSGDRGLVIGAMPASQPRGLGAGTGTGCGGSEVDAASTLHRLLLVERCGPVGSLELHPAVALGLSEALAHDFLCHLVSAAGLSGALCTPASMLSWRRCPCWCAGGCCLAVIQTCSVVLWLGGLMAGGGWMGRVNPVPDSARGPPARAGAGSRQCGPLLSRVDCGTPASAGLHGQGPSGGGSDRQE